MWDSVYAYNANVTNNYGPSFGQSRLSLSHHSLFLPVSTYNTWPLNYDNDYTFIDTTEQNVFVISENGKKSAVLHTRSFSLLSLNLHLLSPSTSILYGHWRFYIFIVRTIMF